MVRAAAASACTCTLATLVASFGASSTDVVQVVGPAALPLHCATADDCANEALALLLQWQLGFEHGPSNATTGAEFRAATVPKATVLAARAVQLDPHSATAATAHSTALLLNFKWAAAAAEANRAVALNRSDPAALAWLSKIQTSQQQLGIALQTAEQAEALAPTDPGFVVGTGAVLYFMEDYASLRDKLLPVVRRDPSNVAAWDWLAMAYKGLGNFTEALQCYHTALELAPDDVKYPVTELQASVAHTYGVAGRQADGEKVLAQLLETAKTAYVEPVRLAFVYTALGHHEQALQELSAATSLYQWELAFVRSEPWFKPLHGSRGFAALVERIGFPSH
jgi:tetratricopeptide (TPR) repeat protein